MRTQQEIPIEEKPTEMIIEVPSVRGELNWASEYRPLAVPHRSKMYTLRYALNLIPVTKIEAIYIRGGSEERWSVVELYRQQWWNPLVLQMFGCDWKL